MAEAKPIIINNFHQGTAQSAYLGAQEIRNLNINDIPGLMYPNKSLAKASGTAVTGTLTWFKTLGNYIYATDSSGAVYDVANSYTKRTGFSSNTGSCLALWKGYLFITASNSVEVMNLSSFAVTTSWDGVAIDSNSSYPRPSIIAQNDLLYIAAGRYLYSLQQVDGKTFNPADNTTFIYTKRALTLPEGYIITQLAELGSWLAIGTRKESSSENADVFLWDKYSVSHELPLQITGNGVRQMITVGNLLYIHAGDFGQWYVSDGSSVRLLAKIPEAYKMESPQPGAVCMYRNLIYFGGIVQSAYSQFGVLSLDPASGKFLMENTISTGNIETSEVKTIGALIVKNGTFYCGWRDNTTYGVDTLTGNEYTGDKAHYVSQFYRVGYRLSKKTFNKLEIQLGRPLKTSDSVKIYYRLNDETSSGNPRGSWTLAATMNTVGETSAHYPFAVSCETIQFKIIVNNTAQVMEITAI